MTMRRFPVAAAVRTPVVRRNGGNGPALNGLLAALVSLGGMTAAPSIVHAAKATVSATHSAAAFAHPSRALWSEARNAPASVSSSGAAPSVRPLRYRAATLDRNALGALAATAPMERTSAARQNPLVVSLPDPAGGFQRFNIAESPVMEPGLAARHPNIKTYAGRGIDDPAATIRMDLTPLGFHASVRSSKGRWFIDPYYHLDDSLYVSYYARDARNSGGPLIEPALTEPQLALTRGLYKAGDRVQVRGVGYVPGSQVAITVKNTALDALPRQTVYAVASADGTVAGTVVADPYKNVGSYEVTVSDGRSSATTTYQVVAEGASADAAVGDQLRTYRLALLTDPAYANYFGGPANVTAAKVTLMNRVTQVYEDETSIRLTLIANNDLLNLDTAAKFSQANGPCGGTACFPTASVSCTGATITRNRVVIGLLVGASNFDIGHIAVGAGGGGVASLGVVGGNNKAQGCTGLPTPVGDLFAVDYVAHEMGHQFAGNHTFNGTIGSCAGGNRSAANSVEPGSGSSIMAYAGICGSNDIQPHSDPYWSQRSFDEIVTYVSAAETTINEVQASALIGFNTDGQQFQLSYNGNLSTPIVRGSSYTVAGIKAAIETIPGWPTGGLVTVSTLNDTTFTVAFGGTLAGVNASALQLVNCTGGCSGYVGEIAVGGLTKRGGNTVTPNGNSPPVVAALTSYTIPVQTPFALTGTATDADGDTITYMWEQNNRGGAAGTSLLSNTKLDGPLFRQFGTRADVSAAATLLYNSPGQNAVTTDPTRVFPDLVQILANNTNAESGACPTASATPTLPQIDCYSEFLPTAAYVGPMNFKLTARDGKGGVNSASTQLTLAPTAGPFLVTSQSTAATVDSGSSQLVSWSVANTNAAPVNTANVRITLSADGGATFPFVLAGATANDGNQAVTMPAVGTTAARIKVEAVDNVFFDVSNVDFGIKLLGDLNIDGAVNCADLAIVRASFGKRPGDAGYDPRADVVVDNLIDARDLAFVSKRVTTPVRCS